MNVERIIKRIILEEFSKHGIDVEEVILFGSRARGDFREDSDWDILVVVTQDIDRDTYRELWYSVYKRIDFPVDLIIVPKKILEKYRDSTGFIYHYALKEGIQI